MALALRCLTRVAARGVLAPSTASCLKVLSKSIHAKNSPLIKDVDTSKLPEFETSSDPNEWKYVERLIPPELIPVPKTEGNFASGWVPPQPEKALKNPYFITRTKNHMQPVYFLHSMRGNRQRTLIRYIDGDIWQLEKDLRAFIDKKHQERHITRKIPYPYISTIYSKVNEMARQIIFRGDHVSLVKMWMDEKGF